MDVPSRPVLFAASHAFWSTVHVANWAFQCDKIGVKQSQCWCRQTDLGIPKGRHHPKPTASWWPDGHRHLLR